MYDASASRHVHCFQEISASIILTARLPDCLRPCLGLETRQKYRTPVYSRCKSPEGPHLTDPTASSVHPTEVLPRARNSRKSTLWSTLCSYISSANWRVILAAVGHLRLHCFSGDVGGRRWFLGSLSVGSPSWFSVLSVRESQLMFRAIWPLICLLRLCKNSRVDYGNANPKRREGEKGLGWHILRSLIGIMVPEVENKRARCKDSYW